ncbi:hypothetical protein ACWELJ_09890 [Nocardia sp. NPDC004582]
MAGIRAVAGKVGSRPGGGVQQGRGPVPGGQAGERLAEVFGEQLRQRPGRDGVEAYAVAKAVRLARPISMNAA